MCIAIIAWLVALAKLYLPWGLSMKNIQLAIVALCFGFPLSSKAVSYIPWYFETIEYQSGASSIEMGKSPAVYILNTATNGVAISNISYSFLLSGQVPGAYVPVNFSGQFGLVFEGDQPRQGGNWSQARFAISAYDGDQLPNANFRGEGLVLDARCGAHIEGGGCGATSGTLPTSNYEQSGASFIDVQFSSVGAASLSGTFSGTIFAPTDSLGYSKGSVFLGAVAGSGNALKSLTFIDPHFEIDPVWLADHPATAFLLPNGVGNQLTQNPLAPVPEPASGWMLAGGLALLFAAKQRKRGLRS